MNKPLLIAIAMLALTVMMAVPTYAFVIPPNPSLEDNNWELFGPHVKGINIIVYSTTTTEWAAMAGHNLDIEDWALDLTHVNQWDDAGGPITEANYGGEAGYFLLDLNNNATYGASDSGTFVHNPTSELPLRQALAFAANRSYIVDFTGGLALPMYTLVPLYMDGYVNKLIAPGQALEALTYGGFSGNLTAANLLLNASGYTIDGSGWRIDPVTQGGSGAELNLIFYSRAGDRGTFGDYYDNILRTQLHIKTTYYSNVPRSTVTGPVFAQEYYNIYTGGWTGIGPDPDFLCDLYNGSNYYHPGSPPNYLGCDYPDLNGNLTNIKLATSYPAGNVSTLAAQRSFAEHAAAIPLFCYTGVKSYYNVPVAAGAAGNWTHLVNQKGVGVNSWWATLSMQQKNKIYPDNYTYYGFSSTVTLQNIVYAQWFWDFEVIGRIYDGGAARDPMTLATYNPQLYKNWVIGTWKDPSAGNAIKTKVTITLRPDAYWQDGQPVTAADVLYTLTEASKALLKKGFPPPWWYPTVQYMRSVEMLDPYNIEILLDVNSVWAVGWVIGSVVIPKHIWKPIIDASISPTNNPIVQGTTPDANIIGTGPFRFVSGIGDTVGSQVVLQANKPNSIVNSITSPGYYLYYPVWVDINPDNGSSKITLDPTTLSVTSNITITTRNLWYDGNLTVDKYIYINNGTKNPAGFPTNGNITNPALGINLVTVYPYPSGTSDVETLNILLPRHTLFFLTVAEKIVGPALIPDGEANPWLNTWINVTLPIYVTTKVDLAASNLYKDMGYNTPTRFPQNQTSYPNDLILEVGTSDFKVDGKDLGAVATAFGSYPGSATWNSACDINNDYKVDGKDLGAVAALFGWPPVGP